MTTPTDWRGTPITEGALVIYGAPVDRSIAMVEATVAAAPFVTPAGKIRLNVVRRAYGSAESDTVVVGADRLTIVDRLPDTDRETLAQKLMRRAREVEERERVYATHTAVREREPVGGPTRPLPVWSPLQYRCTTCSITGYPELVAADCKGAPA